MNREKTYKIFRELFFETASAGKSVIYEDFRDLETARTYAKDDLQSFTGYYEIREYDASHVIAGPRELDNGKTVDILHNCLAIKVSFVTDNQAIAEETVKDALNAFGYPVVMLDLIDSFRKCVDAYGKERTEEEWEEISSDSDESWFDDYEFVFAVIVGCSADHQNELEEILSDYGVEIYEEDE